MNWNVKHEYHNAGNSNTKINRPLRIPKIKDVKEFKKGCKQESYKGGWDPKGAAL